ncbi:release factor glutamine methyltransferase [Bacteroidia bacterium]|nr:release factor glutamine methyltransferase [Bacteroidia bacterium]
MQHHFTLQSLLFETQQQLLTLYSEREAKTLSYLLCEHFCNQNKAELLLHLQESIELSIAEKIQCATQQLLQSLPIQHITGYTIFCNCRIRVNQHVLIPRQETEELVEWILQNVDAKQSANILDIGTGSGCIAIALAKSLPHAAITGWDISANALQVAVNNTVSNGVDVRFEQRDILQTPVDTTAAQWNIIVSNPPYVCDNERNSLPRNVLYDPPQALFVPDDNPLLFYSRIADFATQHLKPTGNLYFEINEQFGNAVVDLLRAKHFGNVTLRKDLNGKDRMVSATN